MHQKHWTFTQETPATVWIVDNIPAGAQGAVITHIITDGGQILQPDNQIVSPDGLQLSFGVESVAGTAYGDYYIEEDTSDTTVTGDGGVINVTVNQHNNVTSSQQ